MRRRITECWFPETEGIFLITRTVLVFKRAWLLDADWLSTPTLSWFPASKRLGFWKGISETHRLWVWYKHGYFILTWKKINMQQNAVFWWKSKRIFPTEKVLIRSLKSDSVSTAGVARSIELHNFMAAKQEVNFVLHWVALWVLQLTLST